MATVLRMSCCEEGKPASRDMPMFELSTGRSNEALLLVLLVLLLQLELKSLDIVVEADGCCAQLEVELMLGGLPNDELPVSAGPLSLEDVVLKGESDADDAALVGNVGTISGGAAIVVPMWLQLALGCVAFGVANTLRSDGGAEIEVELQFVAGGAARVVLVLLVVQGEGGAPVVVEVAAGAVVVNGLPCCAG